MHPNSNRLISLDLARIISIIGVVLIHLLYPIYSRPDFLGGKVWWVATLLYSNSLVGVPIFIMISGYLLLNKEYSIAQILNKTFFRLTIPLAVWSLFYFWWNSVFNYEKITFPNLLSIISSGSIYHLYYLVILIGLYLLYPLLLLVIKNTKPQEQKYFYLLSWILGIGMYGIYYLKLTTGSAMNIFTWCLPYLGYFVTGYIVSKAKSSQRTDRMMIWVFLVWALFSLILSYEGVVMMKYDFRLLWHPSGIYYFNTFLSPNIIIMSISLFWWLVRGIDWTYLQKHQLTVKLIRTLSSAVYGVFFIHYAVMDWVDIRQGYAIEFVQNNLVTFFVQRTLIIFLVSFGLALAIRKIPVVKYLVGES